MEDLEYVQTFTEMHVMAFKLENNSDANFPVGPISIYKNCSFFPRYFVWFSWICLMVDLLRLGIAE